MDTNNRNKNKFWDLIAKIRARRNSPPSIISAIITLVMFWALFLMAFPQMPKTLRIITIVFLVGISLREGIVLYKRTAGLPLDDDNINEDFYEDCFDDEPDNKASGIYDEKAMTEEGRKEAAMDEILKLYNK